MPLVYSKRQNADANVENRKIPKRTQSLKSENNAPHVAYRSSALREIPLVERKESTSQTNECVQGNRFSVTQNKMNEMKKLNRTTNYVHRRVVKQQLEQRRRENVADDADESSRKPGPIRLPSVHDYDDDAEPSDLSENEGSDEVADIRSVFSYRVGSDHDNSSEHALDNLITSRSDITNDRPSTLQSNLVFQRLYGNNPVHKPKKVSINLPTEEDSTRDVIKLTLRHEKYVTPRRSYMHDIAVPRYSQNAQNGHNPNGYSVITTNSEMFESGMRVDVSLQDRETCSNVYDEQFACSGSETLANSCIKVRQKLKGNSYEVHT